MPRRLSSSLPLSVAGRGVAKLGLTALFLWAIGLPGCDAARGPAEQAADATSGFSPTCMACHGHGDSPAPPRALDGATSSTHRAIGAHTIHLRDNAVSLPVQCSGCHVVPTGIFDEGHLDAELLPRAEVRFSGRALANGATPTWDADKLTCSGTWCHGGAANGGAGDSGGGKLGGRFTQPIWNKIDGTQRSCDACHGAPPPAPHPQAEACEACHAGVVGPNRVILDRSRHIDGKIDVAFTATPPCGACHGDPPSVNHPKLDTCELCHASSVGPNRTLLANGTHRDGKIDFALPVNDCTSCHGAPPTLNDHPKMTQCGPCHSKTVGPMGPGGIAGTLIAGGAHLNGKVDVEVPTACGACHGGKDGGPPPDHNGKSDPTLPTVGAHLAHLQGKTASAGGMACAVCHVLPKSVNEVGHLSGALQTVVFPDGGGLASYKGTVPAYDPKTQRCSDVYCHGATMDGAAHPSPKWTDVDYGCDACHGSPPPGISGHSPLKPGEDTKACSPCHSKTVDKNGALRTDTGAHINGWVDP